MKKKLLFALLSTSFVLASCMGFASAEEETEAETVVEATDDAADLSDDIYSFQMMLDGEVYTFPMSYDEFVARGWEIKDDVSTEIPPNSYTWCSFQKGDLRATCDILNMFVNTLTVDKCDVVGFSVDSYAMDKAPDTTLVLPAGITYGTSTLDDITAAYGPASDTYEGSLYTKLTYQYSTYQNVDLQVDLESGVLNDVDIRNMDTEKCSTANMEAEVSDEIPANVTNYKTPEALSDELFDYIVEFAGDLYQLPAPVSVFLANGWTLKDGSEETVAGKDSGWAYMMKDNQELRVLAKNYEPNITKIENCFVTEIKSDIYTTDLPINLAKGLTRGLTSAELEAALEGIEYETSESSNFKYYNVYGKDSKLDGYQFCVNTEEDVVMNIEVDYRPKSLNAE